MLVDERDDILHEKSIITLLETAKASITFNHDMFILKSKECKFSSGNLTLDRYKVDHKKGQTITEMKPSQYLQGQQSYLGLVNYLNCFSPK